MNNLIKRICNCSCGGKQTDNLIALLAHQCDENGYVGASINDLAVQTNQLPDEVAKQIRCLCLHCKLVKAGFLNDFQDFARVSHYQISNICKQLLWGRLWH